MVTHAPACKPEVSCSSQ